MPRVSVIIPACNEARTLAEIVRRVRAAGLADQIVIVDDGSTDGTAALLPTLASDQPTLDWIRHERTRGKGAAIRTGLRLASGDIVLIQDADLEYDPADSAAVLAPFADSAVHAVYGSRNLRGNPRSSAAFYWGGRALSAWANVLYGARLTDIATGAKAVRAPLIHELNLACDGFEFCEEITARLLRRGVKIHEVPVSYRPRSRAEGKKIRARDGLVALWTLVRLRVARP